MSRLLTIAIPTYNRSARFERQLGWLARNLQGLEERCAVIISDNASLDDTQRVAETWRDGLTVRGISVRLNRNARNIGPLGNIARCIDLSESRFTWVIGDDDDIDDGTPAWLIGRLEADPELASIVMNFRGVGRTQYDRCFGFAGDQYGDGRTVMSECLRQAYFGLAFMTAQVYRTSHAQAALRAWPEGQSNYDYQVFITAFAGMQGRVLATRDTHVTYVTGDNVYERDARVGLKLYADSLEVFLRLRAIGYDAGLCRQLARMHLWRLKKRFVKCALRNNPIRTLATAGRATGYAARLAIAPGKAPNGTPATSAG